MTKYIDTAEQAKMIRKDLKVAFPATTFSVKIKRYSGGSSVTVSWTDGPTTKDVQAIVGYYDGKGMMDMSDYTPMRILTINGEQIHFSGSVSCSRSFSVDFYRRQLEQVCKRFGIETPEVIETYGHPHAPRANSIRIGDYSDLGREHWKKLNATRASDCKLGKMPNRPKIQAVREA